MIQANNTISDIFHDEYSQKRKCYVKWKETAVESSDAALIVDLATCVSVMLAGIDSNGQVWMGRIIFLNAEKMILMCRLNIYPKSEIFSLMIKSVLRPHVLVFSAQDIKKTVSAQKLQGAI